MHIRRIAKSALLWCGLLLATMQSLHAQQPALPEVAVEAVSVRGDRAREARVDLYTRVPYSRLTFLSEASGFVARYEVTAEIYRLDARGRRQGLAVSRLWDRTVPAAESYASTQSDTLFDYTTQSVSLAPGRYLLNVQVEDKASSRSFTTGRPIEVRDLSKPVALSDLLVLDEYDADRQTISPNVSNEVETNHPSFALFYEIYAGRPQRVRVAYEIFRAPAGNARPSVRALLGLGDRDAGGTKLSFSNVDPLSLRNGRNQAAIHVPTDQLGAGDYLVRVSVSDEQGRLLDQSEKRISVRWNGLTDHISNLEEAISQLQYTAKRDEIRFIREAKTDADRLTRLRAFWQKRDPTPGTERNERMEEYYYRIAYVNKQYSRFGKGWQTDRGEVFVRFGEPDEIQRHPFSFGAQPYEVWYYRRIGRRFIFVDKSGVGDYQLMVPIWDERTRM